MKYFSVIDLYKRWSYTKPGVYKLVRRDDFPKPFAVVSEGRVKIFREDDIAEYEKNKPWLFDEKKKRIDKDCFSF